MSEDQSELPVALYDFLYKDSSRLASYYAQIFSGRLSALEEIDSEREVKDQNAGLNVGIVAGGVKTSSEFQTTKKRVIDPHDLVTTDVLSHLVANYRLDQNLNEAPHHSLVLTSGTLTFLDKAMIELAILAWETSVPKNPKTPAGREAAYATKLMKAYFQNSSIPSAFTLHCEGDLQVAGTLKETALEEPISTYYFKHGIGGLAGVYLIGIKETPSSPIAMSGAPLFGAVQQAAQALNELIFDPASVRVTPIAMFRKL